MRRSLVAVLLLSLPLSLAAPTAPVAGAADGGLGAGQFALSLWLKKKPRPVLYLAAGYRGTMAGGVEALAFIARSPCRTKVRRNVRIIICSVSVRGRPASFDELQIDPLLRSARLEKHIGRHHHVATWTGKGGALPPHDIDVRQGAGTAEVGVSLQREANARGRLFGVGLRPKGFSPAFLVTVSGAFVDAFGEGAVRLTDDGVLSVHRTAVLR